MRGGKRQAQKLLTSLTAELDRHGPTARHTIDELLNAHIDHLETRGRGARTIEGYRTIARGVAADVTLGKTRLDKVTVKSLDDFYNRLTNRGLSPASVGRYHALLRSAFKQAMAWGWIAANPVQLATPPSVPRVGRKIATPKVVAALLAEAAASRNPQNLVAFRLLAATGARRGEICGLRWSAVDLNTGRIEIRAAIAQLNNRQVVEKEPKTHQIREVTVDTQTVDLLRKHHGSQVALAAKLGAELSSEAFVLADMTLDPAGEAATQPNRLTQAFARIRARIPGAENMRLHDYADLRVMPTSVWDPLRGAAFGLLMSA